MPGWEPYGRMDAEIDIRDLEQSCTAWARDFAAKVSLSIVSWEQDCEFLRGII